MAIKTKFMNILCNGGDLWDKAVNEGDLWEKAVNEGDLGCPSRETWL